MSDWAMKGRCNQPFYRIRSSIISCKQSKHNVYRKAYRSHIYSRVCRISEPHIGYDCSRCLFSSAPCRPPRVHPIILLRSTRSQPRAREDISIWVAYRISDGSLLLIEISAATCFQHHLRQPCENDQVQDRGSLKAKQPSQGPQQLA